MKYGLYKIFILENKIFLWKVLAVFSMFLKALGCPPWELFSILRDNYIKIWTNFSKSILYKKIFKCLGLICIMMLKWNECQELKLVKLKSRPKFDFKFIILYLFDFCLTSDFSLKWYGYEYLLSTWHVYCDNTYTFTCSHIFIHPFIQQILIKCSL